AARGPALLAPLLAVGEALEPRFRARAPGGDFPGRVVRPRAGVGGRVDGNHLDAVDRAGCEAELAAAALRRNHRVHPAPRADDGVDRADIDALAAPDAARLVDH